MRAAILGQRIETHTSIGFRSSPLGGDPAFPAPLEKRRDSLFDGRGTDHFGVADLEEHLTCWFDDDEVRAWALLTYGQTGDRESPDFEVQTVRFSEKAWRTVAYTEAQIEADPQLTTEQVTGN